jgi:hypothetical protein
MPFIAGLICVSSVFGNEETDRRKAELYGAVHSVSTVPFSREGHSWREGQHIVTTYDERGRELETGYYNTSEAGGSLYEKTVHKYDEQGRRIETASYDDTGAFLRRISYVYDAQERLVETVGVDGVMYIYDRRGRLHKETSERLTLVHSYDTRGRRRETAAYDPHDPGLGIDRTVTTYDVDGNETADITYYRHKAGLPEKGKIPPPAKWVYSYEYDPYGNWVKQTRWDCDSKNKARRPVCQPLAKTVRTISYFSQTSNKRAQQKVKTKK